jgi:hypothetical protein
MARVQRAKEKTMKKKIFTRYGSEVTVIGGNRYTGEITIKRKADGKLFHLFIGELKADGGIETIDQAIRVANESPHPI